MIHNAETVMQDFIDKRIGEGYGILLIPQLFGNQNDYHYLMKYDRENVLVLSDSYDTYVQQYVISQCFAIVGMRYHSNIFSAKMGVPFVAIGYEEKMYGFMERFNLSNYLVRFPKLNKDELNQKWRLLIENYDSYRGFLLNMRKEWRDLAGRTIHMVLAYL